MPREKKFNPDLRELLKEENGKDEDTISRYSLVIATAKLARQISKENEEAEEPVIEKPVTTAIDKLLKGEYKIVEPEELEAL
ncbi:MAG: DNA-directed RNA polymerase subunit omega [Ruminococcaceae bacterium]|nr:DNA-directed RNA polymerase subunit omega [Oscillospiraceae bacterium]